MKYAFRGINYLGIAGAFLVALTALTVYPQRGRTVSDGAVEATGDVVHAVSGRTMSRQSATVKNVQRVASGFERFCLRLRLRGVAAFETDAAPTPGPSDSSTRSVLLLAVWAGAFAIVGFAMTGASRVVGYALAAIAFGGVLLPMHSASGLKLPIDGIVVTALAGIGLIGALWIAFNEFRAGAPERAAKKKAKQDARRARQAAKQPAKPEVPSAPTPQAPSAGPTTEAQPAGSGPSDEFPEERILDSTDLNQLPPPEEVAPAITDAVPVAEGDEDAAVITDAVPVDPALDAMAAAAEEEEAEGEGPADITDAVPVDGIQKMVAEEAEAMMAEAAADGAEDDGPGTVPAMSTDHLPSSYDNAPQPEDVAGNMVTDAVPVSVPFEEPAPVDAEPVDAEPVDAEPVDDRPMITDAVPVEEPLPEPVAEAEPVAVAEAEAAPEPLPHPAARAAAPAADQEPPFPPVPSVSASPLKRRKRRDAGRVILAADGIRRTFRMGAEGLEVLRGVDLQIKGSEILVILGASGAGKSTLLHILGLLDTPTSGRIVYRDEDLARLTTEEQSRVRNRSFGFVFQFYHLLPEFTALENVLMPRMIRFGPGHYLGNRADYVDRARALLDELGLGDRMRHRPSQLSGGERQRVAIARALINDPEIVFCDEPTGNLDSRTAAEIHDTLQRLNEEQGQTFVVVTHNERMAESIGHRHRWMHDGLMYFTREHYDTARDRTRQANDDERAAGGDPATATRTATTGPSDAPDVLSY